MSLAENLGAKKWSILGTDLNTKVLVQAQKGVYMMDRLELLDEQLMQKYCLKGGRSQEGTFRVGDKLRNNVRFKQLNLMKAMPPEIGMFDVIFLRNVLIYFDNETKKQVVERIISALKPGGCFFISHSETLSRITDKLEMVQPSIYIKR
jgi:chemotaxis protein methyltransferase CheR